MRHIKGILLSALLLVPISSLPAQVALGGVATKMDYPGIQPDLVSGVSGIPATAEPLVRHVYLVAPDLLGIVIDAQACILRNLIPYTHQDGDEIQVGGYHGLNKLLLRDGRVQGYICGRDNAWLRPFNVGSGESFNVNWASNPAHFLVTSPDDPAYSNGNYPLQVSRKTAPDELVNRLRVGPERQMTHRHNLFLHLPVPLKEGHQYRIRFLDYTGNFQDEVSFRFFSEALRSEAIHVNLYGYQPSSPKYGYLSMWLGDGGAMECPEGLEFRIVCQGTGRVVHRGPVVLRQAVDEPEYCIDGECWNQNHTNVYEMDFSSLEEPGRYRLVVDRIGCSFPFIVDDSIWENTARLLMKGFLHQRAGIELGPPYTDYIRPRNLHPKDGHVIHLCDPEKFYSINGSNFERIAGSILEDTEVPGAWGGWMDAGDYDRRMTHLYTVRRMMYLYELAPSYFSKLQCNIPESSNQIPDILDEGLWCLDLFRRTQGVYAPGAVSWQIESIEHPRHGETSWLNSLPTALLPPSRDAAWEYIATAAQMARLLAPIDAELADAYVDSVESALKWLEMNPDAPVLGRERKEIQVLACLNLYRLTGRSAWHKAFREGLGELYPSGVHPFFEYNKIDAVAIYAMMDPDQTDPALQEDCRKAIIAFADELLTGASENTYRVLRLRSHPLSRLVPLKSKVLPVIVAHRLTGDEKYTRALSNTVQFTMGLNPVNKSYISGLGEQYFRPYHHDWHADDLPLPAGIPNFGPVIVKTETWDLIGHNWPSDLINPIQKHYGLHPGSLSAWPMPEVCFDQLWIYVVNEFMVQTPMGELLFLSGYLAAQ